MTGFETFWAQGDAITRGVAVLLLLMSVSAWVVIFWKGWLLRKPGTVVVEFLEPIPPGHQRKEFMGILETRLEAATSALLTQG